ncbi:unnamed protein product [Effrenium voratum]|nr:unnamed protein product [Effrenium voratum]
MAVKKPKAMKAMKAMKAKKVKATKLMKVMKKKAVSQIAKGRVAKALVFKGRKEKTRVGNFHQTDLMKNKRGKIVTIKLLGLGPVLFGVARKHEAGMKQYHQISAWTDAVRKAREELGMTGFIPVNGNNWQGKAL